MSMGQGFALPVLEGKDEICKNRRYKVRNEIGKTYL